MKKTNIKQGLVCASMGVFILVLPVAALAKSEVRFAPPPIPMVVDAAVDAAHPICVDPVTATTINTAQKPPASPLDKLLLTSKEVFQGTFVSYIGGVLQLSHPATQVPIALKADFLDTLEFAPSEIQVDDKSDIRVTLNNGDTLEGKLVEFTREKTIVDTGYAGRLTMDSDLVRSLMPITKESGTCISGFGKAQNWHFENGDAASQVITPEKMTLTSNAWVTRAMKWPSSFRLDVEVDASECNLMMGILGSSPTFIQGNGSGFMLQVNNGQGFVEQYRMRKGNSDTQQVATFTLTPRQTYAVSIFGDMEAKRLMVMINGDKCALVSIPNDFKAGKYLELFSDNQTIYSKFKLSQWYGSLEESSDKRDETDMILLSNKDKAAGELLAIKAGKVSFKSEFSSFEVPLNKVISIDLSDQFDCVPAKSKADAQLFFNDSDRVTMALASIQNGKISGSADALGATCILNLSAIKKIVFNLEAPFRIEKKADTESLMEEDVQEEAVDTAAE